MAQKKSPVEKAADILTKAHADLKEVLTEDEHQTILLSVNSTLQRTINQLAHLGGLSIAVNNKQEFPPVTNFMGDEITGPENVSLADLTPAEQDVVLFRDKVDKLFAQFDTLAPEGVLNAYTIPEDQLVVRGVAKRAGMEDYEDATLNLHYLEKIQKAIKKKSTDDAQQSKIEAELKEQEAIVEMQRKLNDAQTKLYGLQEDLKEATAEHDGATTEAAKKKAAKKVEGIQDEIQKGTLHFDELSVQLTMMTGPQQ